MSAWLTEISGKRTLVIGDRVFCLKEGRAESTIIVSHGGAEVNVIESIDTVAMVLELTPVISDEWLVDPAEAENWTRPV